MVITEVRIKLCEENSERLLAFCSVTFDNAFVIRDLKLVETTNGVLSVVMPSRKLTDRCPRCGSKNHLRARFCNQCGERQDEQRAMRAADGSAKLHADIAHPIHSAAREQIQNALVMVYLEEKERSKLPGYVCTYDEFDYDDVPVSYDDVVRSSRASGPHPRGYAEGHGQAGGGSTRMNNPATALVRSRSSINDADSEESGALRLTHIETLRTTYPQLGPIWATLREWVLAHPSLRVFNEFDLAPVAAEVGALSLATAIELMIRAGYVTETFVCETPDGKRLAEYDSWESVPDSVEDEATGSRYPLADIRVVPCYSWLSSLSPREHAQGVIDAPA